MMWGRDLSIDDLLALKPGGSFKIETARDGRQIVTITRPGGAVERLLCPSPGVANQVRLLLADGMAGFIEGAR